MILNSGQHTQPDPQSCRVRSLGGRRGGSPKTNKASRDQNKTEQCKRKHRKSIPPALSQRNQHLTHAMLRKPATTTPKQFQTTWCFGKDGQHAGGARDPAILLDLQKHCGSLKPRQFWQKRSLQQSHFRGRKHISFLDSQRGAPQLR